ncbi:MAG: WD40/YVTN/BNR-like repeat-containing protein, partial [Candidatus Kapaibacterium sp.]
MKRIIPFLLMTIFAVSAGAQQWSNQGPVLPPEGTVTNGQINCLAFNPLNPLKMWVGAPAGGLWVSSDGGATWLSGATDTLAVTGISDIWVSPSDSNTFVIAVGDRDENSSFVPQGGALYLTTDGGVSWSRSGELDTNGSIVPIPNYTSARVLRNTTTGGYVLATSAGVFTSTSFTPNWNNRVMRERSWDLKQRPNDPSTIYAVIGGRVYRSTNAGTSFTALTTGYPNAVAVRVQLAVAPSNANVVYALYVQPDGTFGGIYKSNDAGNTWTVRSTSPNILAANIDGSGSKGVNNLSLAVSPQNENILFAGGVNVWRSVDGGITWQQSSHYAGGALPYVAADIHDLRFAPSPRSQFVYAATGNGIFMSSDTGRTWQNASAGLQTHQGLASAWHPTRDSLFLTAGPTGIHRYDRGAWKRVSDSASSSVWYHPSDLRYAFASTVSGRLLRSSDSAKTFTGDITPAGAAAGGAFRPYVPNPRNTATVYGILRDVWKTTNGGTSWIRTSNPFNATMLSLAVSRGDTNMVYIVTSDTVFYQSTNGGREWLRKGKIQLQFPVVPRAVICHPFDPLRACVYGGRSVSMTRDGGATWEKYVLNGNVAIMSMSWKQDNCGEALILGTTNGVWRLSAPYNFGVPAQVEIVRS